MIICNVIRFIPELTYVSLSKEIEIEGLTLYSPLPKVFLWLIHLLLSDIFWTNLIYHGPCQAGKSQGQAPRQASDYTLRAPNHLDSSTHDQIFYQDFESPNQSRAQVFPPPLPVYRPRRTLIFRYIFSV